MKNLEQIRAARALEMANTLDKIAVNKLPAMIMSNGLLATAAFCLGESDGKNRGGMRSALEIIASHLEKQNHLAPGKGSLEGLIEDLSGRVSHDLQTATTESMAFLGYLRRFAKKDSNSRED